VVSIADGQDFAGTLVEMVVRRLDAPSGDLQRVLTIAGEVRPVEELCDPAGWSTYDQFRALLEATQEVLGEEVVAGLSDSVLAPTMPEVHGLILALGSPDALLAQIVDAGGASMAPVCHVTGESLGHGEWIVRQAFRDRSEHEAFKAYCTFTRGILSGIPRLFGLTGCVTEEACECDGAECCEFRIVWDENETVGTGLLETKVRVLEIQLATQHATINHLISGESLSTVLRRIVDAAARTVNAPWFVLVLDEGSPASQRVYARGLSDDQALDIAARLDRGDEEIDLNRLVVQIESKRCHYGQLIAINPGGAFFPQQRQVLEVYKGLAAAALDSAIAIEEAKRQAATARVLLSLSASLAQITSATEMAETLASAVPTVIGCDRSIVVLRDADQHDARIASAHGYTEETTKWLLSLDVRLPPIRDGAVSVYGEHEARANPLLRDVMRRTESDSFAVVPIIVDSEAAGLVVADIGGRLQGRFDPDELRERLRGLAGQASTAMRNARLLDQVRHQSLHDPLTGLANRELLSDRLTHMFESAARKRVEPAALFVDLDGFKEVNDAFGHGAGDELLQVVATRLQGALRGGDTVGRLGGDEFVALLESTSASEAPEVIAERVLRVLREPMRLQHAQGRTVRVTASIGIASSTTSDVFSLLSDADRALYQAKAAGKNQFVVFARESGSPQGRVRTTTAPA
jgi:diguanylate cyclase (GGDEF)-like protein